MSDMTKAGLFLACVTATAIMVMLLASCGGGSLYEPNCGNPFNLCDRDSLVNLPSDSV